MAFTRSLLSLVEAIAFEYQIQENQYEDLELLNTNLILMESVDRELALDRKSTRLNSSHT